MRVEAFSFVAFLRSVFISWLKYVLIYSGLLAALFAASGIQAGNWSDLLNQFVLSDLQSPMLFLIVFFSFLVGWAGATRKHETRANPFFLLLFGAIIAGIIPGATITGIAFGNDSFSMMVFIAYWLVTGIVTYLLMLWIWFVLGMWGEWSW